MIHAPILKTPTLKASIIVRKTSRKLPKRYKRSVKKVAKKVKRYIKKVQTVKNTDKKVHLTILAKLVEIVDGTFLAYFVLYMYDLY